MNNEHVDLDRAEANIEKDLNRFWNTIERNANKITTVFCVIGAFALGWEGNEIHRAPIAVVRPSHTGNAPIYNLNKQGEMVSVSYYSNHGDNETFCGVVAQWESVSNWQAWSSLDDWHRHYFNTREEATAWLEQTWCKP